MLSWLPSSFSADQAALLLADEAALIITES